MSSNEPTFDDFNDIKVVTKFLLEKEGVTREEAIEAFSRISGYDVALLKNIIN
jgi:hypothetical protein